MCGQCVAEGGLYVGGALGVLQAMKVRAAARRRDAHARDVDPATVPALDDHRPAP